MVRLIRATFIRLDETLFISWDRDLAPGAGIEASRQPVDRSPGKRPPLRPRRAAAPRNGYPPARPARSGRQSRSPCPVWRSEGILRSVAVVICCARLPAIVSRCCQVPGGANCCAGLYFAAPWSPCFAIYCRQVLISVDGCGPFRYYRPSPCILWDTAGHTGTRPPQRKRHHDQYGIETRRRHVDHHG